MAFTDRSSSHSQSCPREIDSGCHGSFQRGEVALGKLFSIPCLPFAPESIVTPGPVLIEWKVVGTEKEMMVLATGKGFQFWCCTPEKLVRVEKGGEWCGITNEIAVGCRVAQLQLFTADLFTGDGEQVIEREFTTAFHPQLPAVFRDVGGGEL